MAELSIFNFPVFTGICSCGTSSELKNWKTCKLLILVLKAEIITIIKSSGKKQYLMMGLTWHMTTKASAGEIIKIKYVGFLNAFAEWVLERRLVENAF